MIFMIQVSRYRVQGGEWLVVREWIVLLETWSNLRYGISKAPYLHYPYFSFVIDCYWLFLMHTTNVCILISPALVQSHFIREVLRLLSFTCTIGFTCSAPTKINRYFQYSFLIMSYVSFYTSHRFCKNWLGQS